MATRGRPRPPRAGGTARTAARRVARRGRRRLSALSVISEDQQRSVFGHICEDQQRSLFGHLCSVLEPRIALDFSSTSSGLWASTQALRQQLRVDYEAMLAQQLLAQQLLALCQKLGMRSFEDLREAREVSSVYKSLCAADLATLGGLGSVLPALKILTLSESTTAPDGVRRLVEGLGAGALPALWHVAICDMNMDDASASALAAALDRGALPRLMDLNLSYNDIGNAGLVALAPALRRRPALESLGLTGNPIGDEGLAALVAPPQPAGALLPPAAGLTMLYLLNLHDTEITDTGCASLASALNSGALPALNFLDLQRIPASFAARASVRDAFAAPLVAHHRRVFKI